MNVTATHARQHFVALLERAIAGEEIAIERHGRLVARLVPAGPVRESHPIMERGKVAEVRGVAPESAISRLFRERALRRLEIAHPRAEAAVAELGRRGVKARIVGSLARGSFRHTSDVDLLVEQRGTLDEGTIETIVRGEMGDFPFDLLYSDRLPTPLKE